MIETTRLLGFAFASADLLFEVDRHGEILFATGATSGFTTQPELVGRKASELFVPPDAARFLTIVHGLSPGDRQGPLPVRLAVGGEASLSMCYLPQNGERVSCTLVRPGERRNLSSGLDAQTGLPDRDAFLELAAASAGGDAGLALVNLPNLPSVVAQLTPGEANALLSHIGATVKKMGAAAGRISETGFGVISDDPDAAKNLAQNIRSAVRERGIDQLEVEEYLVSLKNRGLTPEQTMLALRYVVGRFAKNDLPADHGTDLAQLFDTLVTETLERANALNARVSDGAFDLVFEPIIELDRNTPSHYEALTRFAPGESPAETIKFAEELGLAETFDLAVIVKVFAMLEREQSSTMIAINVSAKSIGTASSFAMLAGLLMRKRALAHRVLIEITESAELPDITAADQAIQAMRSMGYRVGIDDFGAGAASLQYLHALTVDFLKVDGSLIRRLGKSPREDALIKGVLQTCRELGIETIAEWIDSPEKLQRCRAMGFVLGQGRYFGGAVSEFPKPAMLAPTRRMRRVG
jgi:EAL domain-containing protein (putative c-di-GMP-specific phosphodiesterase class I)